MKNIILNQRAERDELMARPYQQRDTRYNFDELLSNPLIKLITGPRRVGKSVFALLMLQGRNFAYLNFDDNLLLENWDEDLVMQMLDDVYPGYEYLLLDEIQNLPDWDLWVNKLYRRGKNLIITGSNAKMLSSEMATVLTGRYLQIEMLPFSLEETMRWRNVNPNLEEQSAQAVVVADDYMRNGGYPETIQSRNITKSYLSTLFDSILLKDVAKRHKVRNTTDLYNLATYLLSNFCNPISANELATELGLSSVTTTKKFCDYLAEPYLFFYLPRFNNKMKLMKKAPSKVYVVDNGFVQSTAFNLSENLGRLLENQVFVELLRRGYIPGKTLFYYRTRNDKEIDFVTRKGSKVEQFKSATICPPRKPENANSMPSSKLPKNSTATTSSSSPTPKKKKSSGRTKHLRLLLIINFNINKMTDFKDIILAVLAILIPAIVAILGYVIHRKTERIKIMESQLSDKKYHAYAGLVDMFFKILKDTKRNNVPNDNLAEQMVDLKKDILLYGSDKVFFAYNNFFDISTNHPGSLKLLMDAWLNLMLEIRQDMCGHSSKITKDDILFNLMQSRDEMNKYYASL